MDLLAPHQKEHVSTMKKLYSTKILSHHGVQIENNRVILDTSKTGSGKTFTACGIAKELNLGIFVICPKSVIEDWYEVAKLFEVDIIGITNYEVIKSQNIYEGYANYYDMSDGWNIEADTYEKYIYKKGDEFIWNMVDTLIIFDEGHKSKNKETINAKLLLGAKKLIDEEKSCKLLILTATPLEKQNQSNWIGKILGYRSGKLEFDGRDVDGIHEIFYSSPIKRAITMNVPPIKFENKIESFLIEVKDSDNKKIRELIANKNLGNIILLREELELEKVDHIIPNIVQDWENGYKVVIFVNFKETIELYAQKLIKEGIPFSLIYGDQTVDERSKEKINFIKGDVHILISTIASGGTGISLHDIKGGEPRISYIMPPESATILKQALGRIYRFGLMSPVHQKIIFGKGNINDVELDTYDRLKEKLSYIEKFVSGEDEEFL